MAKLPEQPMDDVQLDNLKCPKCGATIADGITSLRTGITYETKGIGPDKRVAPASKFVAFHCNKCNTQTNMLTPVS